MLTRSRFGVNENSENAVVNLKENIHVTKSMKTDINIKTRARAALADVKNTNECLNKEPVFKKPIAKDHGKILPQTENVHDMSIDVDSSDLSNDQQAEYLNFLRSRFEVRRHLLQQQNFNDFLDTDSFDVDDGASVSSFAEPIFNYLQDRELSMQPLNSGFISPSSSVTARMRYILINWLVQVHLSYKMQPETLYLCVAILDRYMQKCSTEVTKECFQLIGITALFVASKFEEMFPPDIGDFSSVTDSAYTKKEIRQCEQLILQNTDYYLSIPLPITFLRRLSRAVDADRQMHNIAKYLLELTIQEYDLCYLTGNMRASIAICLSRALSMETSDLNVAWHDAIEYLGGYKLADLIAPLRILAKAAYRQNSPSKFRSIFDKYRLDDYFDRVAALPQLRSYIMESLADLKFEDDDNEAQ